MSKTRLQRQLEVDAAQLQRRYTPRAEASGTLILTAGQVARWFIETYKDEFDSPESPLHGQSTEIWQHCVTFIQKRIKPDPSHPDAGPDAHLHNQIVTIFEREFLPLFACVN